MDDDFPICPGHVTLLDFPTQQHPARFDVTVQCVRPAGHPIVPDELLHFGWILGTGTSVSWDGTLDGKSLDAESAGTGIPIER